MSAWLRVRFYVPDEDYRPTTFPPPGPYWCSGWRGSDDANCVIAYVRTIEQVRYYWPDAMDVEEPQERDHVTFTDRFPRPEWWIQESE